VFDEDVTDNPCSARVVPSEKQPKRVQLGGVELKIMMRPLPPQFKAAFPEQGIAH
jgi:hypothetical protein